MEHFGADSPLHILGAAPAALTFSISVTCARAKNSPHLSEHIKKNQCNYTANINYDQKMQLRGIDLEEGGS